jgi:putative chitinase
MVSAYAAMSVFQVDTPLRQAHFLAQTGHESAGFQRTAEVLNYGGNALIAIFGGRITPEHATQYGRNSMHAANTEMIANIVYANRDGNGDIDSGDGFRYRGRGLIQIAGKDNYVAMMALLGIDIVSQPDLLSDYKLAATSAAVWWKKHGLNELADADDIMGITKVLNGGFNGLEDRKIRLIKAREILCSK